MLQAAQGGSYILLDQMNDEIPKRVNHKALKILSNEKIVDVLQTSKGRSEEIDELDDPEEHYVVEKIIRHRLDANNKHYEYFVK